MEKRYRRKRAKIEEALRRDIGGRERESGVAGGGEREAGVMGERRVLTCTSNQ